MITRFPPEPNGHLHLGHAKAMYVNFQSPKCYLRFDDTNPEQEKMEYVKSIIEDVTWLKHKPYKITYTSDYFDIMYKYAKLLISKGKAYVCDCSSETITKNRLLKLACKCRNNKNSLSEFDKMKNRKYEENTKVLRLNIDMTSKNLVMRDPICYRIKKYTEHFRTKDKWCIYPTYDFSHCIADSIENITHSFCSIEFQSRNELYQWVLNELQLHHKPKQIEFSRLNIKNAILSKRKLKEIIQKNSNIDWDHSSLLTIKGMRKKGYTPDAINNFCKTLGLNIGKSGKTNNIGHLENFVRKDLNRKARRVMGVFNPIDVIIENLNPIREDQYTVNAMNLPNQKYNRKITYSNHLLISDKDFREKANRKYYGITIGRIVRLKYLFLVQCISVERNSDGSVKTIFVKRIDNYKGKIRGTITWVNSKKNTSCTILDYPNKIKVLLDDDNLKQNEHIQIERFGFCIVCDKTTNSLTLTTRMKNKYIK